MTKRNPFTSTTAPDNDVINNAVVRYQQLHAQFVEDLMAHEEVQGCLHEHLSTMLESGEGTRATDGIHQLIQRLTKNPKLSGSELLLQLENLGFTVREREELLQSLTSRLIATDSLTKTKDDQITKLLDDIFVFCSRRLWTISARYAGSREEPETYMGLGFVCLNHAIIRWRADAGQDFLSYLGAVFTNGIKKELHDNHSVHGRPQAAGDLRAVEETIEKLKCQLGRPPTDEEVASAMGKSASIIKGILGQKIEMISLDAPLSHDSGDRTLHDSSLCLSHNDDQGGLIHPVDEKDVHRLIVTCVAKFLKSSPHRMSEEPPALALRLPARCFLPVKGEPRPLNDAIAALRWVGMQDLKKALQDEKNARGPR